MVDVNTNMRVNEELLVNAKQQSPEQKALSMARAGLAANKNLDAATKEVIATILTSYSEFGVDISKYSDLSYDCLSRISQNQHETIMTMLEDWAIFLQQQAALDKEASQKSQEAAKEIEHYILNQRQVIITNSKGQIVKDKRVIKHMSVEQKRMLQLANNYRKIVTNVAAPVATVTTRPAEKVNLGVERAPVTSAPMNPNRISLAPPQDDIGVATSATGTRVN